ncbi:MAG: ankyrin repeat domain-containing protein [Pseudomonadota bacterium]
MDPKLLRILNNRQQNYPNALAQQFPRILSKLVAMWESPEIDNYFSDLLIADRHDRQGFPPDVVSDIIYLSMVHHKQRGEEPKAVWGHVSENAKEEIEQQGIPFSPDGLIKAAESGSTQIVSLFLQSGFDVDTTDERLWTPLMISAFNGDMEMAELLIKSGASILHRDNAGYTPLHWAAFNGYANVVRLLLDKKIDADIRSNHDWTALLQAATRGHLTVCSILIERGANVNAASRDGWTPLHKAAANGHLPVVVLLMNKGADVMAKYADGTTALDLVSKTKNQQLMNILSKK